MNLRKKTLFIIGVILISLIVILYTTSNIILLDGFEGLEEQNTKKNLERTLSALSDEIAALDVFNADWSAWDDTYEFIEDGNLEYIESNLVDETFIGARLNLMLFINSSNQIVFGKSFDLNDETEILVPQSFLEHLSANALLLSHNDTESNITGIILLSEDPMLISSRPILTSEEEGPIRGTLIMGRYLDFAEIEQLAALTHLSLDIYPLNDPGMPPDFQAAIASLSGEEPIFIQPVSTESICGYALLNDIYGNPGLVLKADMPRDIYAQGQDTIRYFIISLLVIGLVFIVVSLLLLEKLVLSRLTTLSTSVSSIGKSNDLSARLSTTGKDELSSLASEINAMLVSLEHSQAELRESEAKSKAILDAIPDMMFRITRDGVFQDYKAFSEGEFHVSGGEIIRKNIRDLLPSEVVDLSLHHIAKALDSGDIQVFEYQLPVQQGVRDYESRLVVSGDNEALAIVRDITEHKQAENKLKASLREKEVLLKEIHHRVKNNLQVISSLLNLQSKLAKDEPTLEIFKESQNRIKTMALIHERLYKSKDLTKIDFAGYIRKLTAELFHSYKVNPNAIKLKINVDAVPLNVNTAIPCSLITNELVSNSLEHAFPNGREGEISIDLYLDKDNRFTLIVKDNGIGFPKDLDFRNTKSLGVQLVTTLVEQLEGTIELDKRDGTAFKIKFEKPEDEKKRQ